MFFLLSYFRLVAENVTYFGSYFLNVCSNYMTRERVISFIIFSTVYGMLIIRDFVSHSLTNLKGVLTKKSFYNLVTIQGLTFVISRKRRQNKRKNLNYNAFFCNLKMLNFDLNQYSLPTHSLDIFTKVNQITL